MSADLTAARKVAEIAAEHADDVDRQARFPAEAISAAADLGLLTHDPDTRQLTRVAGILARSCGSTAMIWAMHQLQLACLVRHGGHTALVPDGVLIASVTSEAGIGGDIRRSDAALTSDGKLTKRATTVSYGAQAGGFLITARRHQDAAPSDQVAVLAIGEQVTATQTGTWDPMGMRGTCSPAFTITASVPAEQVLPVPFADIAEQTMLPLSHILWSAVWLGLATEAFERARTLLRRKRSGAPEALAHADVLLTGGEAQLADAIDHYERGGFTTSFGVRLNALKLAASAAAVTVTGMAMDLCGMPGYQERNEYSIARLLRDAHSGPLMVANHRLAEANATSLLVVRRG